eukprot:973945-Prymnesium_polylepis.1
MATERAEERGAQEQCSVTNWSSSVMISPLFALVASAPASDRVTSLPGWAGALPSPLYSGFLALPGTQKQLHYLLVEAEVPLDKATAPLVLWLNGGPGCSSLEGFFYEHGPLVVGAAHAPPNINFADDPSANGNATGLFRNPWSWSRAASVLYLEAPAGVGFSYSPDPREVSAPTRPIARAHARGPHTASHRLAAKVAPLARQLVTGDNQTAADNLAALQRFFELFPEYKKNDFY